MATAFKELVSEEDVVKALPGLRQKFLEKYAEKIESEKYDQRDVERIKTDDAYLKCFVRSYGDHEDPEKPVDMIDSTLLFRKEININDFTDSTFPDDLRERNFLYWKGVDLAGHKMLHFKVCNHKKGHQVPEVKNFISYFLDQQQRAHPGERIVIVFDFSGAGVTNVDLDVTKFIISVLSYFPCIFAYILNYEMSWLLSSVWKIIRSWLTEDQRKRIHQVKKNDLEKYVEASQIVLHFS